MAELDGHVFATLKEEMERDSAESSPSADLAIRQKIIEYLLENRSQIHFRYWIKGRHMKETLRKATVGSLLPRSAKKLLLEVCVCVHLVSVVAYE